MLPANQSFASASFPSSLKQALLKPTFKKGEKTLVDNYRPISILNGSSKIFEKAFANRFLKFLKKIGILTENQHGFRKINVILHFLNTFSVYLKKKTVKSSYFQFSVI